jgi:hypothetical protein
MAVVPFCEPGKHHSPTCRSIVPNSINSAADLFQTAEWFGGMACAFRLILALRRLADLARA